LATDKEILASVKPGKPPADCPEIGTWQLCSDVRERLCDRRTGNAGYTLARRRLAHLLDKAGAK